MSELFTLEEIQRHLREEVAQAGGANKWLRKHKATGFDHCLHMIDNGSAASLDGVLPLLGLKKVVRYEAVGSRS